MFGVPKTTLRFNYLLEIFIELRKAQSYGLLQQEICVKTNKGKRSIGQSPRKTRYRLVCPSGVVWTVSAYFACSGRLMTCIDCCQLEKLTSLGVQGLCWACSAWLTLVTPPPAPAEVTLIQCGPGS